MLVVITHHFDKWHMVNWAGRAPPHYKEYHYTVDMMAAQADDKNMCAH